MEDGGQSADKAKEAHKFSRQFPPISHREIKNKWRIGIVVSWWLRLVKFFEKKVLVEI